MPTAREPQATPPVAAPPAKAAGEAARADRMLDVLERIAAALQQGAAVAGTGNGASSTAVQVDPIRARVAEDYLVLSGLLRHPDSPVPLAMQRADSSSKYDIIIDDPVPVSVERAVVQSHPSGASDPVVEKVAINRTGRQVVLVLKKITAAMPISRVELFTRDDRFVAFGPSLPPAESGE